MLFAAAALQAATTQTTLTVNASGGVTGTNLTATGPATLTNIGNGTFSGTLSLTAISGSSLSIPFTITLSGGTLAGTITSPPSLLTGNGNGSSATIDPNKSTGAYAGATGSFPSLNGTGSFSGTSLSLTFSGAGSITTGGSTGGGTPTPTVTALQNNYSYILPGLPNYGIAPGALFILKGSNLANQAPLVLQSSAAPGLPKSLNGASVSVTVNGTTTTPLIYYTSPGQLGLVLPSSTPVGTGTVTVTNSGQTSATFPIQVVKSAVGLDTLSGSGTGAGVAQDANYNLLTSTSAGTPGQAIILWGSGVGADTANDDATYPLKQDDLTNAVGLKLYIGGIQAAVAYAGRSQFPGVDQIEATIPANVTPGCSVSVVAVAGTVSSNFVTIPVAATPGACSDSIFGISAGQASSLSGKSTVNFGFLSVSQSVSGGTTTNLASALFQSVSGTSFSGNAGSGASIGSCIVNAATVGTGTPPTVTGLDAGSITMNGPAGSVSLLGIPNFLGFYGAQLAANAIPAGGGTFTFNGTGGKNVGSFNTNVNFPVPLVWTNMSSITSVNRSQGVTVNWTGGASGTYVQISGSSSATINGQITSVGFTCNAPVSAGTFTVPPPVLLALPAGNGSLSVDNSTNPSPFTASGLDAAYAFASVTANISPTYN